MADIPIATGNLPSGEHFQFFLDGVATYKQMERMLLKIDALVKRFKAEELDQTKIKKEKDEELDTLKTKNKATDTYVESLGDLNKGTKNVHLTTQLLSGNFRSFAYSLSDTNKKLLIFTEAAFAINTLIGALTKYSDQLGLALQRGVAGGVMDFAISAKLSGLTLEQFNKALEVSDGSFNQLGDSATEGSRNFADLINTVRLTTADVGNLGLSLGQLGELTGEQVKGVVAQGFRGKRAQEVVQKNTESLAKNLDDLAARTGRTVSEMAKAAAKLAADPTIASFISQSKLMGEGISKATNKMVTDFVGLFGEQGGKIAEDAIKSAFSGLPFAVTESGKNLSGIGQRVATEIERQSRLIRSGIELTEEDRKRLRTIVLEEVEARGESLRMIANYNGAGSAGAKQLLALAAEARKYNEGEIKRNKDREDQAKKFRAATNEFEANLQRLKIPLLEFLNKVNWTLMFDILNSFIKTVEVLLTPIAMLGKILGAGGGVGGTLLGAFLALVAVVSTGSLVFNALKSATTVLTSAFLEAAALFKTPKPRYVLVDGKPVLKETPTGPGPAGGREADRTGRTVTTLGERLKKFSAIVNGVSLALAGSALAMWGESRLAEDANDTFGQVLKFAGEASMALGIWGGLLFQFIPYLKDVGGWLVKLGSGLMTFAAPIMRLAPILLRFVPWLGLIITVGTVLVGAFKLLDSAITSITDAFSSLWNTLGDWWNGLTGWISNLFSWKNEGTTGAAKQVSFSATNPNNPTSAVPVDQKIIGGGAEVKQTQVAAIDAANARAESEKVTNQKVITLLTDIKESNEMSLGIQAKGVAVADSSNRYLRDQRMYS